VETEGVISPMSRPERISREIVLIVAAIVLYFLVRGWIHTRTDVAFRNAERVIDLERGAGLFHEPALQNAIAHHSWLVGAADYVYIYGHWPVIAVTLLWLLIRHRREYPRFRNAMLISGAIGLVIFATFPVAPPRFLPAYGFVDTVTENTTAYRVLQPPAFLNAYAAVPSLHFGWNLLMGIAWAGLAGHWAARVFGWLMPLAMLAAIVLTANHYLVDGLAGGTLALFSLLVATRLARRSARPTRAQVAMASQPRTLPARTRFRLDVPHEQRGQFAWPAARPHGSSVPAQEADRECCGRDECAGDDGQRDRIGREPDLRVLHRRHHMGEQQHVPGTTQALTHELTGTVGTGQEHHHEEQDQSEPLCRAGVRHDRTE
jgi:PAP2 superfamily